MCCTCTCQRWRQELENHLGNLRMRTINVYERMPFDFAQLTNTLGAGPVPLFGSGSLPDAVVIDDLMLAFFLCHHFIALCRQSSFLVEELVLVASTVHLYYYAIWPDHRLDLWAPCLTKHTTQLLRGRAQKCSRHHPLRHLLDPKSTRAR